MHFIKHSLEQDGSRAFQIVWLLNKSLFCIKEYIGFSMSVDIVEK